MRYSIIWSIDIEAETPRDAAEEALKIQRDPESTATCFEVMDDEGTVINIDLLKDPEKALRELWTKRGVPKGTQDAIIREVEERAKPGTMVGPFKIPE